ncbi:MAG: hypothetical protein HeimC2_32140 [Candidatus Heimdallarchaeota archaeon LC_2]|nr:MAG: hypothetical protein HeimC2_32140 [Candidatus Heimdallarchaeota archaeon LC_2]
MNEFEIIFSSVEEIIDLLKTGNSLSFVNDHDLCFSSDTTVIFYENGEFQTINVGNNWIDQSSSIIDEEDLVEYLKAKIEFHIDIEYGIIDPHDLKSDYNDDFPEFAELKKWEVA